MCVAQDTPAVAGGTAEALDEQHAPEEVYHDASTRPGQARIVLTAVLSDQARRTIASQHRFWAGAPVTTADAACAVQAFNVALGPLLDEIVDWTGQAARSRMASP